MNEDRYYMESLDKAMRVAEVLLGEEGRAVKIMDIAEKVGISRNNAFRILCNFGRRGWAVRINGSWRLGGKLNDFSASRMEAWKAQARRMLEEGDKLRGLMEGNNN